MRIGHIRDNSHVSTLSTAICWNIPANYERSGHFLTHSVGRIPVDVQIDCKLWINNWKREWLQLTQPLTVVLYRCCGVEFCRKSTNRKINVNNTDENNFWEEYCREKRVILRRVVSSVEWRESLWGERQGCQSMRALMWISFTWVRETFYRILFSAR